MDSTSLARRASAFRLHAESIKSIKLRWMLYMLAARIDAKLAIRLPRELAKETV